jgi:hypothetical protein
MPIEASSARPSTGRRLPRPSWWVWLLSIAMTVTVVLVAWWAGIPLRVVLIATLAFHGLLALFLRSVLRQYSDQLRRAESVPVPRRWVIDDIGITVTASGTERHWRWAAVTAVERTPDTYLFRQADGLFRQVGGLTIDLPRDALDEAREAALLEYLTANRLL